MNLIVKDIDLFQNIEPETVANYLENLGWRRQKQIDNQETFPKMPIFERRGKGLRTFSGNV